MRVPDNLDIYEMHEREQIRRNKRIEKIKRLNQLDLEEELGFKTVDEANGKGEKGVDEDM